MTTRIAAYSHLLNVYDELQSLLIKKNEYFWENPYAASSPYDDEIERLSVLQAEGVEYEPKF